MPTEEQKYNANLAKLSRLKGEMEAAERAMRASPLQNGKPLTDSQLVARTDFQVRADSALSFHNRQAPPPFPTETPQQYKARVLDDMKRYSEENKHINFDHAAEEQVLDIFADKIFADSERAAKSGWGVPPGEMREVKSKDQSGRVVSEFYGASPDVWMRDFKWQKRRLVGIEGKPIKNVPY